MKFLFVIVFVSFMMFLLRKEKFEYRERYDETSTLVERDLDEKE